MVPFRAFDREKKEMWVIINYHPGTSAGDDGTYLAARENDTEQDGQLEILPAGNLAGFRLVDFLDDGDSMPD